MKIFFDSFNAKHLKSVDIANNFVSSKLFLETAKNSHTILVGPRGSGKTTFLRMLSNSTLPKWEKYEEVTKQGIIGYEGIYVPGDLVWGEMIRSLNEAGLDDSYSEAFSYTAFFTHVLLNTVEGIETSLNQLPIDFLQEKEEEIYEALESICVILKINPKKISLSRIRHELMSRLNVLGEYSRFLSISGSDSFNIDEFQSKVPYAYTDMKLALESVLDAIDQALDRPEHRWALLLDEFEIAPRYLLDKVISSMRSSAKKILFKVALVPCGFHQQINSETSSINDYSVVELWYVKKGESNEFCKNMLSTRYNISSPIEKLGSTKFGSNTKVNSNHWLNVFEELFEKDITFKAFILGKKINFREELSRTTAASSIIRKISPMVAFRNAFLNVHGNRKGRKSLSEFYSGWEAIFTISEGNPRWLISVLNSLIQDSGSQKISEPDQMKKIHHSTESYAAMLKTLPLSNNMGLSTKQPVFTLLERIGHYFNSRVIGDDFGSSPPSTFTVDKNITEDIESALMIAWNYGAIVSVSTENTFGTYDSLKGMRFRLSFLLAPQFELTLTTGPTINLSTILAGKPKEQSVDPRQQIQGDLFL